jgi:hypothetical protein
MHNQTSSASNDKAEPFPPGTLVRVVWWDEIVAIPSGDIAIIQYDDWGSEGVATLSSLTKLRELKDPDPAGAVTLTHYLNQFEHTTHALRIPHGTQGLMVIDHWINPGGLVWQKILWKEKTLWVAKDMLAPMAGSITARLDE